MKIFVLAIFFLLLATVKCQGQHGNGTACLATPCQNEGTCLINSRNPAEFVCSCSPFFNGTFCENYIGPFNCQDKPCLNGGTCFQNVNNTIWCDCPVRYSGALCHKLNVSACESHPCKNNGICTPHEDQFTCSCAPGFAGPTCSGIITTRCASEPCQNGGTCFVSSLDVEQYFCMCAPGYTGEQCHKSVTECSCENGGHCQPIPLTTGGIGLQCVCPPGYSGTHCEIAPVNLCDKKPCVHGTCFLHGTNQSEYFCDCEEGFIGKNCSTPVQEGSCSSDPCLNSGSCSPVISSSGTEYTHCECPPGYVGINCETPTEGCSPNPCHNGGLCLASSPTTVTCQCEIGFVGSHCQFEGACHSNPCQNNGTCYNAYQPQDELPGYACDCQGIYRGINCNETTDPCASHPCQNGGICLKSVDGDVFTCICLVQFTGDVCETPIGEVCWSNPMACYGDGEVCVEDDDGFHCECIDNWLRNPEDTACYAPCTMNRCHNGGSCFQQEEEDFLCICPEGHTGRSCEQPLTPCDICKNGGTCVMYLSAFYCECQDGYSGIDCSESTISTTTVEPVQPCPSDACQNGGTCEPFPQAGFHCICPEGYSGLDCSLQISTPTAATSTTPLSSTQTTGMIISNKDICKLIDPCENNAICLPNTNSKGELYPMCLCQPGFGGATCSVTLPTPTVCVGNPCGPDAECFSNATAISGYSCRCLRSDGLCFGNYFAESTPTPTRFMPPCESNPCQNGGTCKENGALFTCICPLYFVGDICETDIRDCVYEDVWYSQGNIRSEGCITCNCSNGDWQCTDDNCYCEHENKLYENGQTWTDQCMTCFCYNGGWLCSDVDCSSTCQHEGNRYFSGEVREESCKTCFCRNGNWTCTDKECDFCVDGDAVFLEGAVRNVDCNLCTCSRKEWMCTVKNCDELPLTVSVIFHLDYPFSLVEDRQDQLIRVITAYLEARYDLQNGQLLGILLSDGSIVVNITLQETLGTDRDIRLVADQIREKVHSGSLTIAFDGFLLPAKNDSYSVTVVGVDDEEDSILFQAFLFACLASLLVIAVFLVAMCLCRRHSRKAKRGRSSQKRKLWRSTGSESSEDFPPSGAVDATQQNSHENKGKEETHIALSVPQKVMTCPGRLRQKGLEGI